MIGGTAVNGMYVGQTSAKLIGGGGSYNMMSMDMNVGGHQPLMMDPADCVRVCLSVCLSVCLHVLLPCTFVAVCPSVSK